MGDKKMAQAISETAFKYLTAFQLVILIFTLFMQQFGFDEDRHVVIGVAILLVAAFVYKKDKDNKVQLHQNDVTPLDEMTIKKAISIIEEAFGIKDKDAETIEILKGKIAALQVEITKENLV